MNEVRIGLIGVGWMGRAHATAIRSVPLYFGSELAVPVLEVVADATPELAEAGARAVGCRRWTADWREVVGDANVDVVDITSPNNTHAEIAIAAAGEGGDDAPALAAGMGQQVAGEVHAAALPCGAEDPG